jgi:CO/xanthine dehydrogenase FAD-binding subunit
VIIDINRIPGLDAWAVTGDGVRIGARVRQRSLERDTALRTKIPVMAEAVQFIGHPATRSRGTIVGSMCHADPAAELQVCAILLGATFRLRSQSADRVVSAEEFFLDALTTAVGEDELVEEVRLPLPVVGAGYSFSEVSRRHGDFAMVSVGCVVSRDDQGGLDDSAVALGGIGRRAQRFRLGDFAAGATPAPALFEDFAGHVAQTIEPDADLHASAEYRRALAAHLVQQGMGIAASRTELGAQ